MHILGHIEPGSQDSPERVFCAYNIQRLRELYPPERPIFISTSLMPFVLVQLTMIYDFMANKWEEEFKQIDEYYRIQVRALNPDAHVTRMDRIWRKLIIYGIVNMPIAAPTRVLLPLNFRSPLQPANTSLPQDRPPPPDDSHMRESTPASPTVQVKTEVKVKVKAKIIDPASIEIQESNAPPDCEVKSEIDSDENDGHSSSEVATELMLASIPLTSFFGFR